MKTMQRRRGNWRLNYFAKGGLFQPPDYLIAGHALSLGFVVVTDNLKHFDGIENLTVENWRKPLA